MRVTENSIVQVITEVSPQMGNPKYITARVDKLMRAQPSITQYINAFQKELSVEGVVSVLFYASLIEAAIAHALGRSPDRVSYRELDEAARSAPEVEDLAASEGDLASFIVSNVELTPAATPIARRVLAHIARALVG